MRWALKQILSAPTYYYDNQNPQCAITPSGNKYVAYSYGEYDSGYETIITFTHNGTEWVYNNSFVPTVVNKGICSIAISSDGLVLYFGNGSSSSVGIQVFDWTGGVWVKRVSNICIPSTACTWYGCGISLSPDNTVMVICGATLQTTNNYYTYIYTYDWNGSAWVYRNRVQGYNIQSLLSNSRSNKTAFFSDGQKLVVLNMIEKVLNKGTIRTYENIDGTWTEISDSVLISTTGYSFISGCCSMTNSNRLYTASINYYLLTAEMFDWDSVQNKFVKITMALPSNNLYVLGCAACNITDGRLVGIGYNEVGRGFIFSYESFDNMLRGVVKYNERLSDRIHNIEVLTAGTSTIIASGQSKSDGTFLIDVPIPNANYPVDVKVYDNNLVYGETLLED